MAINLSESELEHDRWWIDKKLKDVERFEQRHLQIIGLIVVIVTLLSPQLPPEDFLSIVCWSITIICVSGLVGIYVFFSLN